MKNVLYRIFSNSRWQNLPDDEFQLASDPTNPIRVFSTLLAEPKENDLQIFLFEQHLQRVLRDAQSLNIYQGHLVEHDAHYLSHKILETLASYVQSFGLNKTRVRIILTHEGAELHLSPYGPRWNEESPISLCSFVGVRPHSANKSTYIEISHRASNSAATQGAHEALLISNENIVLEGAWSNFFWRDRNGQLCTTEHSVLPGVTRDWVCKHFPCRLTSITLEELLATAQEVFITQSTTGITLVETINDVAFQINPNSLTQQIRSAYQTARQNDSQGIRTLLQQFSKSHE